MYNFDENIVCDVWMSFLLHRLLSPGQSCLDVEDRDLRREPSRPPRCPASRSRSLFLDLPNRRSRVPAVHTASIAE